MLRTPNVNPPAADSPGGAWAPTEKNTATGPRLIADPPSLFWPLTCVTRCTQDSRRTAEGFVSKEMANFLSLQAGRTYPTRENM